MAWLVSGISSLLKRTASVLPVQSVSARAVLYCLFIGSFGLQGVCIVLYEARNTQGAYIDSHVRRHIGWQRANFELMEVCQDSRIDHT